MEIRTPILLGLDQVKNVEIKDELVQFLKGENLTTDQIKGYQQGSGPNKLGRHLFKYWNHLKETPHLD